MTPRHGTKRFCRTCGVDWWAVAAGRIPVRVQAPGEPSRRSAMPVAGWWGAVPLGQRLRIGIGVAGILLIGLYTLVDIPTDASGPDERAASNATVRPDELSGAAPDSGPAAGSDSTPGATPAPGEAANLADSAPTSQAPEPQETAPQPGASATPAATTTPQATPAPASLPTTVVLQGSGSQVTEPFAYPGGSVRVHSSASTGSGAGCVYIGTFRSTDPAALPLDDSLLTALIFLETPGSGEGWVDLALPPGTYFMEIETDCDWVVTVAPG